MNPVRRFKKSLRLKVPAGTEPFTDIELGKLWQAMKDERPVYLTMAKGSRCHRGQARRADRLRPDRIRHHYDQAQGLVEPKDGEPRTVYLTAPAVRVFEEWIKVRGPEPGPLFPHPEHGGRIDGQRDLAARVTAAIEKAGILKVGEGGRPRKPFHALRASYTRLMLEQGRNPAWVQGQLGHSTADLTLNVYGKWSQAALQAEAEAVEDTLPV